MAEQVGGKGMPEHVGGYWLCDAGIPRRCLYYLPESQPGHAAAPPGYEEVIGSLSLENERSCGLQIAIESFFGLIAKRDQPLLVPFADYPDKARGQTDTDTGGGLRRELRPRLVWDRVHDRLRARDGAKRLAVTSGGTIPDRGLFGVFLPDGTRVGELDEEMVYESRVGDVFALGATDAFWLAFTIPNALRVLLGEGAVSAAFVPVFTEVQERAGRERASRALHQPGPHELARELGVSQGTVRKALDEMVRDNILRRKQGRGPATDWPAPGCGRSPGPHPSPRSRR